MRKSGFVCGKDTFAMRMIHLNTIPKETVLERILPLVEDNLRKANNRGLPISPMAQVLIALRFFSTGSFQIVNGDLRGVSQLTVSSTVKRVSEAIDAHTGEFIKFPDNNVILRNMRHFFGIGHLPNVSACIDRTHIEIKNPEDEIGEVSRNMKHTFSLNIQIACGPNMEIFDIVARYPGSTHDSTIFDRSSLRVRYENGEIPGYTCKRYLLTLLINSVRRPEINYNLAHKRTRNVVERCFGVWKSHFPCLRRGLLTNLNTSVAIICAVAVLHNLARPGADDIAMDPNYVLDQEDPDQFIIDNLDANAYRRIFIMTHFNQ